MSAAVRQCAICQTPSPFCLCSSKHEYENNYIAAFPNVFINNVCIQTNWESGNDCNCYFPACPVSFLGPSLLACVCVVWRLVISGGAGLFPRCHCNNAPKLFLPQAEAARFNSTHWDWLTKVRDYFKSCLCDYTYFFIGYNIHLRSAEQCVRPQNHNSRGRLVVSCVYLHCHMPAI